MKKVIIDASPLIFVAKADILGVLKKMYKKVTLTKLIMNEIQKPLELGYKAPEVDLIKSFNVIEIEELTAKEIVEAQKISVRNNIGSGESEAAVLFKRGGFDLVIVADIRAQRKLRELDVNVLDLVDVGFEAARRGIMNPREFAKRLYEKGHYRTQRIKDILGRKE